MADLGGGGPSSGSRAQNGGSRTTGGPVPVGPSAVRPMTPRDILKRRQERDAERKADSDRIREQEAEERRLELEERRVSAERRAAAGVAGVSTTMREQEAEERRLALEARRISAERRALLEERRISAERRATDPGVAGVSNTMRESSGNQRPPVAAEKRNDRPAGTAIPRGTPSTNGPSQTYMPAGNRTQESQPPRPTVTTSNLPQPTSSRNRPTQTAQPQPRPVQAPATRVPSNNAQEQPAQNRQPSGTAATNQVQGQSAAPSSRTQPPQSSSAPSRNPTTSSFPHAFERWETLSSHWEGLTSYWIKRLEGNSDEMSGQPLNNQLARQVTDLSAAGANLFHAVVELQRLRASSERKFQRWFFEIRADQEAKREEVAKLEAALLAEKQARAEASSAGGERQAQVDATSRLQAENASTDEIKRNAELMVKEIRRDAEQVKRNAEQMVKEMRRELQISRDEARRGWEEIGRMEQAERDRTESLKSGQPTLIGGVQVVPMLQGDSSRQASTNRPPTRPQPGDTGLGGTQGVREADDQSRAEVGYTLYDPARSETDTDPFTEGGREATGHGPPKSTTSSTPAYQQTSDSASAAVMSRTAPASHSTSPQRSTVPPSSATSVGGTYLSYGPDGTMPPTMPAGPFYQHQGTDAALHQDTIPRPNTTEADQRSYTDTISEEEYDYDEHGEIRRDAQGRPLLFSRGNVLSEGSDEYDVQHEMERERMYGAQYGAGASGADYGSGSTQTAGNGNGNGQSARPADYSGSGYGSGWEAVPRHHHPTRLSDVLEEDERSRTSPSRASERSRGLR